ncbi:RNA polymerase sigma factor [Mediterraneibacter glycyrrhizinilyticus]|uniref:RNA polymerase sigma factor n=1 Tax=Mediterraneibacter glycyrrhizinilyticus TaxID=342942 RepID=UPI0025A3C8C5|nr:sigma-70 family RNA polymerase sigma factor [Mediterraneibacter glycyrrhizinilyticus]MDM8211473.1 sigma-70 family RNA polymerase sigma factor [Mediterraneibacter glycyrrhizinilyticus]
MDSDFFLIRKMRQGDEDAFDAFIRKYYGDILRYCACHCLDAEDAQDLTQETFVRFFSRFSDYRHKGKTKNYLYTIAGNLCKNYYKKNKAPAADDVYGESGDTTESLEDSVIERAALEWALDYLEPELRDVIDLYYFRELKLREMAETLFAILIIPELWKNRANCCMEIEGSTYYALRQIYSARILLFGLADIPDRTADTVYLSNDSYSLYLFRNLWEQKSGQ